MDLCPPSNNYSCPALIEIDLRQRYFHRIRIVGDCKADEPRRIVAQEDSPREKLHDIIPVAPYFPTRTMSSQPKREGMKTKLWWSDEDGHHEAASPITERRTVVHHLPRSHYETNSMEKPVSKSRIKKPMNITMRPAFELDYERDYEELARERLAEEKHTQQQEALLLRREESERRRNLGNLGRNPDQRKRWAFNSNPRKVVRKSPYRRKQVPLRVTPGKVRRVSKKRLAVKRNRPHKTLARVVSRRTSKVTSKPAWAYVGDPTMRAYRTQEPSFRSDFHF